MKKLIALLLIAACIITTSVGCGDKASTGGSKSSGGAADTKSK